MFCSADARKETVGPVTVTRYTPNSYVTPPYVDDQGLQLSYDAFKREFVGLHVDKDAGRLEPKHLWAADAMRIEFCNNTCRAFLAASFGVEEQKIIDACLKKYNFAKIDPFSTKTQQMQPHYKMTSYEFACAVKIYGDKPTLWQRKMSSIEYGYMFPNMEELGEKRPKPYNNLRFQWMTDTHDADVAIMEVGGHEKGCPSTEWKKLVKAVKDGKISPAQFKFFVMCERKKPGSSAVFMAKGPTGGRATASRATQVKI